MTFGIKISWNTDEMPLIKYLLSALSDIPRKWRVPQCGEMCVGKHVKIKCSSIASKINPKLFWGARVFFLHCAVDSFVHFMNRLKLYYEKGIDPNHAKICRTTEVTIQENLCCSRFWKWYLKHLLMKRYRNEMVKSIMMVKIWCVCTCVPFLEISFPNLHLA